MITDQQYRSAIERIDALERKINTLSKAMSELVLKSDRGSMKAAAGEETEVRKDVTRYRYNGTIYCKRNLVLAVLKDFINDKSVKTSAELNSVFPESVQGSLGVFRSIYEAEKYNNSAARFFFQDEDVLRLDDGDFVVCKEWTCKNIKRFLNTADHNGIKIDIINRN